MRGRCSRVGVALADNDVLLQCSMMTTPERSRSATSSVWRRSSANPSPTRRCGYGRCEAAAACAADPPCGAIGAQEMIEEADKDGDGMINQEEFFRVMKKRSDNPLDDLDSDDD